jgi:ribonuclease HII
MPIKSPLEITYNPEYKYEICIDEVGRGCLFGPAYICAVVLPRDGSFSLKDIKDSKKFSSKKKIKTVSDYIKQNALIYHIESVDSSLIDEVNILKAVMRGMHQCIKHCITKLFEKSLITKPLSKNDILCVIDGNYFLPYHFFDESSETLTEIPSVTVEQGDAKYAGIAAASIIAKVARDEYIIEVCNQYPDLITKYGLDTNVGYGTKKHMDGIKEHGITKWHRKTFAPCKDYLVIES